MLKEMASSSGNAHNYFSMRMEGVPTGAQGKGVAASELSWEAHQGVRGGAGSSRRPELCSISTVELLCALQQVLTLSELSFPCHWIRASQGSCWFPLSREHRSSSTKLFTG